MIGDFSTSSMSRLISNPAVTPFPLTCAILSDGWNRKSHPMTKGEFGVFEIVLPPKDGQPAIPHNSKVKVSVVYGVSVAEPEKAL